MSWIEDTAGGTNGQYISLKLGETQTFTIRSIERTTDNPDWHPKTKQKVSQGWHLRITDLQGRVLEVGAFALQTALREAGMKDRENPQGPLIGRVVTIRHEDRGSYQVVLGGGGAVPTEDVPF